MLPSSRTSRSSSSWALSSSISDSSSSSSTGNNAAHDDEVESDVEDDADGDAADNADRRIQHLRQQFANRSIHEIQTKLVQMGWQYKQQQSTDDENNDHDDGTLHVQSAALLLQPPSSSSLQPQEKEQDDDNENDDPWMTSDSDSGIYVSSSTIMEKVPGCLSTVYIQTSITTTTTTTNTTTTARRDNNNNSTRTADDNQNNNGTIMHDAATMVVVHIRGTSDAHVSRGLLSVLVQLVDGQSVSYILNELNADTLAMSLGLEKALGQSRRQNGFINMIHTIQKQVRHLLLLLYDNSSSGDNDNNKKNQQLAEEEEIAEATTTALLTPARGESRDDDEEQSQQNSSRDNEGQLAEGTAIVAAAATAVTTTIISTTPAAAAAAAAATESQDNDHYSQRRQRPHQRHTKKVALLLSGGVDSSVALRLLLEDDTVNNYNVTAFYLKIWLEDELRHLNVCPWQDDIQMCELVCEQLGVKLEIVSLQQEYQKHVLQYTLQQAKSGRTPNPDILCNSRIKFGCFYEYIETHYDDKYDCIATGHYAQIVERCPNNDNNDNDNENTDIVRLLRAPDPIKDQSYFLCALTQKQLSKIIFPIGHLQKHEVRQLANKFNLPNRNRPDSQGLCFLGKVKFDTFLQTYLGKNPGPIIDATTAASSSSSTTNGESLLASFDNNNNNNNNNIRLGTHDGLWFHTIGQRKGIGNFLLPQATARGPWYVVAKDPTTNTLYVSNEYNNHNNDDNDDDDLTFLQAARSQFTVQDFTWTAGHAPQVLPQETGTSKILQCDMKIRHGPHLVAGTVDIETGQIQLDSMDKGLAPGQYVAFYNNTECLGGAVISEQHWIDFIAASRQAHEVQSQQEIPTITT